MYKRRYIYEEKHNRGKRSLKALKAEFFLEKLIKVRPIKMVTSFLALL